MHVQQCTHALLAGLLACWLTWAVTPQQQHTLIARYSGEARPGDHPCGYWLCPALQIAARAKGVPPEPVMELASLMMAHDMLHWDVAIPLAKRLANTMWEEYDCKKRPGECVAHVP